MYKMNTTIRNHLEEFPLAANEYTGLKFEKINKPDHIYLFLRDTISRLYGATEVKISDDDTFDTEDSSDYKFIARQNAFLGMKVTLKKAKLVENDDEYSEDHTLTH